MSVRRSRGAAAVLGLALAVGACGMGAEDGPLVTPQAIVPDGPTPPPEIVRAQSELFDALGREGLSAVPSRTLFRPPEAEPLVPANRAVYQVTLPDDPGRGFIVVYDLGSAAAAMDAAEAQAAYLASGPVRVQSPLGTRHVIRVLDSTVLYHEWRPEAARDERAPRIEDALRTIGRGVEVPD
jgi:hypothetical protein